MDTQFTNAEEMDMLLYDCVKAVNLSRARVGIPKIPQGAPPTGLSIWQKQCEPWILTRHIENIITGKDTEIDIRRLHEQVILS